MKKLVFLLILLVVFLTGCSTKNINEISEEEVIKSVMSEANAKTNVAFKGYKIYLPKGMQVLDDVNNNNVLYSSFEKYYLYVDVVSYYNNTSNEYKINTEKEPFFSTVLNYDNKNGYILITKYNDKYFVEVMYNYGKIEVITRDYKEAIAKSLVVLKSIEYNDKIIETLIGTNVLKYDEEEFNLLGPSKETIDFLQEYEGSDDEYEDSEEEIKISD